MKCGAGSQVRRGAQPSPLGPLPRQSAFGGPGWPSRACPVLDTGSWPIRLRRSTLDNAHRSGRAGGNHHPPKAERRRFFSLAGRLTRKARRLTLHLPQGWPWQNHFSRALARLRALGV
ncbi:MAG: transposase [Dehalococcoidia bacterium]|nr:transposase [Dehalococcoidia bacterium]